MSTLAHVAGALVGVALVLALVGLWMFCWGVLWVVVEVCKLFGCDWTGD